MRFSSGSNLFKSTLLRRSVLCFIALLILFSFGLHIAHMNHYHEEAVYGVGLEAVMHNTDRKWLFALISVALSIFLLWTQLFELKRHTISYKRLHTRMVIRISLLISKLFNYLLEALRRGTLQPILYN